MSEATYEHIKSVNESVEESIANETKELNTANNELVDRLNTQYPGLLVRLHTALLKMRVDMVTEFTLDIFEQVGVKNAREALAHKWETAYNATLKGLVEEAGKARLLEGVRQTGD